MLADFHTHPLAHRYYYEGIRPDDLTDRDRQDIVCVLQLSVDRGLDAVAITDHDLALSGLWARQYALEKRMPLRVIPGCECELYFMEEYVHLLALNLTHPLDYGTFTPPEELAVQVRGQGGILILAHPMAYRSEKIYHGLKTTVQGVEYRNGAQELGGRPSWQKILEADRYRGLRLHNSDYHYLKGTCAPRAMPSEQRKAYNEMDVADFVRIFGQERF